MLCAGYAKPMYLSPCEGDSGDPIVDSTTGVLMGTVSFAGSPIYGYGRYDGHREPEVYSNIANLRGYIDENMS